MVLLITSAIICNKDKVLLIKRNKEPDKGKWALPGGTGSFKKYPNPIDAVKDEVKYDLKAEFIIDSFFNYSFYEGKEGSAVTLHFKGKLLSNPNPNKDEVSEWKYFSQNELQENIAFDHKEVLKRFFENGKHR